MKVSIFESQKISKSFIKVNLQIKHSVQLHTAQTYSEFTLISLHQYLLLHSKYTMQIYNITRNTFVCYIANKFCDKHLHYNS